MNHRTCISTFWFSLLRRSVLRHGISFLQIPVDDKAATKREYANPGYSSSCFIFERNFLHKEYHVFQPQRHRVYCFFTPAPVSHQKYGNSPCTSPTSKPTQTYNIYTCACLVRELDGLSFYREPNPTPPDKMLHRFTPDKRVILSIADYGQCTRQFLCGCGWQGLSRCVAASSSTVWVSPLMGYIDLCAGRCACVKAAGISIHRFPVACSSVENPRCYLCCVSFFELWDGKHMHAVHIQQHQQSRSRQRYAPISSLGTTQTERIGQHSIQRTSPPSPTTTFADIIERRT